MSKSSSIRKRVSSKSKIIKKKKPVKASASAETRKKEQKQLAQSKKASASSALRKNRDRLVLKKQKERERKRAQLEAKKKRQELDRQRKLQKREQTKQRILEMKRRKKAKQDLLKQTRAAASLARKEIERAKKLVAKERRKAQQESQRKKRDDDAANQKEQRKIFKLAEKAVSKGELLFEGGSLMVTAATELSFASAASSSWANYGEDESKDEVVEGPPQSAPQTSQSDDTRSSNNNISSSSSSFLPVENCLLKLPTDQLAKLGIDKKALSRSVNAAIAAKNRGPQERCCVCEEAWRPAIVSKNKKTIASPNLSAVIQQQQQQEQHHQDDAAETSTPFCLSSSFSSAPNGTFQLSFKCKCCQRPVHKSCLHAALIKDWDLEGEIEKAVMDTKKTDTFNDDDENLFQSLGFLSAAREEVVSNNNNNNNNNNKTDVQKRPKKTATAVAAVCVVVPVECVVCRSGKIPDSVFTSVTSPSLPSSTTINTNEDDIDNSSSSFADEMVPLSPPGLGTNIMVPYQQGTTSSVIPAAPPAPPPPFSSSSSSLSFSTQTHNQQQDVADTGTSLSSSFCVSFPKGTHKYDFVAALQRQLQAATLLSSPPLDSRRLLTRCDVSSSNNGRLVPLLDSFADHLSGYLLRDGFVVVPLRALYGESNVDRFVEAQKRRCLTLLAGFLRSYEIMVNNEGSAPSLEGGFSNFRERGFRRYEMIHPELLEKPVMEFVEGINVTDKEGDDDDDNSSANNSSNNIIMKILERCFNKKPKKNTSHSTNDADAKNGILKAAAGFSKISSGCFIAESGAAKQTWHTDGPSLALPKHMDLLPYALNVFIPLINVDATNGTCFLPGSHLDSSISGPENFVASASTSRSVSSNFVVAPKVAAGDVLIFDYRVWHRGLGNSGSATRPVVYATFSPTWFVDTQNFSQSRYKKKLEPVFF